MNDKIEKMIASLLVDEDAKAVLMNADRILNSDSDGLRNSAFTPLVIAGEGCGFSSYGRVYSAIVDTDRWLSTDFINHRTHHMDIVRIQRINESLL